MKREHLYSKLVEVLEELTPDEAKILEMRFGVADDKPATIEDVNETFQHVNRDEIRGLESETLKRLRMSTIDQDEFLEQ